MALPGVSLNVLDGNLNLQSGSNEQVVLYLGTCTDGTPNTLASYGDSSTLQTALGYGEVVEAAAYGLEVGGGPVMVMPLTPDLAGSAGSVTHAGAGTGTLAVTLAPHKSITIACTTTGSLGTAAFTFQLGSAAPSAPVTSAAGWSSTGYRVPGTFTTVVFVAGTYTGSSDVYTISTAGAIAHTAGTGATVPTQTSSPLDNYNIVATITTSGALATAKFTYSLDNGESNLAGGGITSSEIVTAGSGIYVIPNTGVVLTFAGTLTASDTYTFKTCTARSSSLSTALTALETTYLSQDTFAMAAVINMPGSASAWGTLASTLETAATALFNSGIYMRFISEVPTIGSIFTSTGALVVDSADTDAVLISQRASVSASHVMGAAGDCLLTSPISGLTLRRSCAWTAAARASSVEASQNLGFVGLGGLTGVAYLFRDEFATQGLDAAGYTTMRSYNGIPGKYITDAHTCAASTSDYYPFANARVIDLGCGIARSNALPLVNGKIPTTTRNSLPGVITEKKAQQIEAKISGALRTGLVDVEPQDAVAASCVVNRTHNILADGNLILAVAIQPFAYSRTVTVNIGLTVAA